MRMTFAAIIAIALSATAHAADDGVLNPEELTLDSAIARALNGETNMVNCAHGYHVTKEGRHEQARLLLEACAEAGYTAAMTWMAYMEDNGLGAPEDAAAAAAWDRRAAEAGDPIGQFNYGLDLLRGRGVQRDAVLGRTYIDRAAAAGVDVARRLQDAEYDLEEVTPDADSWKYQRLF